MRRYLLIDEDGQASVADEIRPPIGDGQAPMLVVDLHGARRNFSRLVKGRTMFSANELAKVCGGSRSRVANWLGIGILRPTIPSRGIHGDQFSFDEAFICGFCGSLTRARQTRPTIKRVAAA